MDLEGTGTLIIALIGVYNTWRTIRVERQGKRTEARGEANAVLVRSAVSLAAANTAVIVDHADVHAAASELAVAAVAADVKDIASATEGLTTAMVGANGNLASKRPIA